MIGLIIARLGLSQGAGRVVANVSAVVGLIALLGLLAGLWLHFHDKGVIREHEAKVAGTVAAAASSAEAGANAKDQVRAEARERAELELRKAIDDAVAAQPEKVRAPAGPAVNAVAERLRRHGSPGNARP